MQARPVSGLSPRTRGTRHRAGAVLAVNRFIPAYAGNTRPWAASHCGTSVHPRVRGEHGHSSCGGTPRNGSSPRTRGTPGRRSGCRPSRPVHPRVRGEHPPCLPYLSLASGSSPRTRGTRRHVEPVNRDRRFIPAYAGNTWSAAVARTHTSVHPRVRGEHFEGAHINEAQRGSSPRTRGTRVRNRLGGTMGRFIPAYAGNTSI